MKQPLKLELLCTIKIKEKSKKNIKGVVVSIYVGL